MKIGDKVKVFSLGLGDKVKIYDEGQYVLDEIMNKYEPGYIPEPGWVRGELHSFLGDGMAEIWCSDTGQSVPYPVSELRPA